MPTRKVPRPPRPPVSTAEALALAVAGEDSALNDLIQHYLPSIKRSARGRLPKGARDRGDTDDLVQDALVGFLGRLRQFKALRPGAMLAFLHISIKNRIRDEARRLSRRPAIEDIDVAELTASSRSPFEEVALRETAVRFERALATLREPERRAIAGVELGYSYEELAGVLGKPTANAARVASVRAFNKVVARMVVEPGQPRRTNRV